MSALLVAASLVIVFALGLRAGWALYAVYKRVGASTALRDVVDLEAELSAGEPLRFFALGDTGEHTAQQRRVADTLLRLDSELGSDFVLLLGDNFYNHGVQSVDDPRFTDSFEDLYARLGKPVLPVLGNHDIKGSVLTQVMYSLRSRIWRMPNYAYRFRLGPARFFALNTNANLLQWWRLARTLRAAPAHEGWTIVFGHHSIYSTGDHGDMDPFQRRVWERRIAPHVDLYVCAHNHVLEHLTRPGTRPAYLVSGGGCKTKKDAAAIQRNRHETLAESHFVHWHGGVAWCEVTAARLRVCYFDADGAPLHRFELTRGEQPAGLAAG